MRLLTVEIGIVVPGDHPALSAYTWSFYRHLGWPAKVAIQSMAAPANLPRQALGARHEQ